MSKRGVGIIFLISLVLLAGIVSADVNLKITGTIGNYSASVYLKSNSGSTSGTDSFDMETSPAPDTFATFYSDIDGTAFSVDSWDGSARTIDLVYSLPEAQTGTLTFSWVQVTGGTAASFDYYGDDSEYGTAESSTNMRSSGSASVSLNGESTIYARVVLTTYTASDTASPASPGGSSSSSSADNARNPALITVNKDEVNSGTSTIAKKSDVIEFYIDLTETTSGGEVSIGGGAGAGGEVTLGEGESLQRHTMTIVEVGSNTVSLIVRSKELNVTLHVGDVARFNLNGDDFYDLYTKLNSIVDEKVNITMKKIYDQILSEEERDIAVTPRFQVYWQELVSKYLGNENIVLVLKIASIVIILAIIIILKIVVSRKVKYHKAKKYVEKVKTHNKKNLRV